MPFQELAAAVRKPVPALATSIQGLAGAPLSWRFPNVSASPVPGGQPAPPLTAVGPEAAPAVPATSQSPGRDPAGPPGGPSELDALDALSMLDAYVH